MELFVRAIFSFVVGFFVGYGLVTLIQQAVAYVS